jgi:hypothetical protein
MIKKIIENTIEFLNTIIYVLLAVPLLFISIIIFIIGNMSDVKAEIKHLLFE